MCGTAHARSHDDSRDRRRRRSVKSQGRQTTHPARWYSSRGGWGMKRVLVVYFSQTGQLRRVAESLCAPLTAAGVEVDWCALQPRQPYPFPWPFFRFFDQFPETVDRKSVGKGKSVSVRVDPGGRRIINKNIKEDN